MLYLGVHDATRGQSPWFFIVCSPHAVGQSLAFLLGSATPCVGAGSVAWTSARLLPASRCRALGLAGLRWAGLGLAAAAHREDGGPGLASLGVPSPRTG